MNEGIPKKRQEEMHEAFGNKLDAREKDIDALDEAFFASKNPQEWSSNILDGEGLFREELSALAVEENITAEEFTYLNDQIRGRIQEGFQETLNEKNKEFFLSVEDPVIDPLSFETQVAPERDVIQIDGFENPYALVEPRAETSPGETAGTETEAMLAEDVINPVAESGQAQAAITPEGVRAQVEDSVEKNAEAVYEPEQSSPEKTHSTPTQGSGSGGGEAVRITTPGAGIFKNGLAVAVFGALFAGSWLLDKTLGFGKWASQKWGFKWAHKLLFERKKAKGGGKKK